MKLIEFEEQSVVIAKDQPEYLPLPAFQFANDPSGRIAFCWQFSWRERLRLLFSGKLWHTVLTFHQPLQPVMLMLDRPFAAEDVAATAVAKRAAEAREAFRDEMLAKYGEAVRKRQAHFDALNYHKNDRRRCVVFAPEDFRRAEEFGLCFLHGARIVDEGNRTAGTGAGGV
jgi:hypothetical protein